MNWGCNHETDLHWRILAEACAGALRHCPTCGAPAYRRGPRDFGWGDPRDSWKEAHRRANSVEDGTENIRPSTDWSRPRPIVWLPPDHPNFYVTSPAEARRVCREWGIDPERGGFISEKHKERAFAAARRNRAGFLDSVGPRRRALIRAARSRSRRGVLRD